MFVGFAGVVDRPIHESMKSRFLKLTLVALSLAVIVGFCRYFGWIAFPSQVLTALRWTAILSLAGYGVERKSLTVWIFIGMAAGIEFGYLWPSTAVQLQVFGTIFLRLVKVIIAPLLFSTLVMGIAGHADLKKVGRVGIKALIYFEIVSTLALVIGFLAINISQAGVGVHMPPSPIKEVFDSTPHSTRDLLINIFPENIARSVAEGQILQIVVFSILFGLALSLVAEPKKSPLVAWLGSLSETMFKFTNLVMLAAPIGVFGAVAYTVGHLGVGVLLPLLRLLATMYVALVVFVLVVLLPISFLARVPLRRFLRAVTEPVTIAFATSSSEAALPRAMEQLETLGVSRETVSLVLPLGYSFNLDGSSLYQSLALIFVSQAAGVHLTFSQQMAMLLTLLVSSKGTAGVARASLIIVLAVATAFQLPAETVFLLFGIDQLMDMARTAINVLGNCLATVVIARWEGEPGLFQSVPAQASAALRSTDAN